MNMNMKYEREREREKDYVCWLIGGVENGLEGDLLCVCMCVCMRERERERERDREKRGMVGLLVFDSILVFFDAFSFTHKVIIIFVCENAALLLPLHIIISLSNYT